VHIETFKFWKILDTKSFENVMQRINRKCHEMTEINFWQKVGRNLIGLLML